MKKFYAFMLSFFLAAALLPPYAKASENDQFISALAPAPQASDYERYKAAFDAIGAVGDIAAAGYEAAEPEFITDYFASACVDAECTLYPAVNRQYGRAALFFAGDDGKILYKTDDLECNNFLPDSLYQPNTGIAAVSERDLNGDGYKDILLLTNCAYDGGKFKIGDILYQGKDSFYRDWRVTDNINRFGMNKDIDMMTAYARDGQSAEFLYSASTLDELEKGGFVPLQWQTFDVDFQKFGSVTVVPGTYAMGRNYIFIIYLVNSDGQIVWNFQPMHNNDNFSQMTHISFKDVDGDGWADLTVLAIYKTLDDNNDTITVTDFSIYYQRSGYFFEDKDFHAEYLPKLTGSETTEDIVQAARLYWGW
ncbi:MAG: VCBS repeat-containing protein [Defluviitaleaceae bacterium]|nr:VCBS repeat-containing protein [Defluviitaleaceae bacterium]